MPRPQSAGKGAALTPFWIGWNCGVTRLTLGSLLYASGIRISSPFLLQGR
jgi:hypothetical protein